MKAVKPSIGNDKAVRVIINVPSKLLKAFDDVCENQSYQRTEGIKEAMRSFISAETENADAFDSKKVTEKQMKNIALLLQELKNSTKSEFYKKMK